MAMMLLALRRYRDFKGRSGQREFWSFALLCSAVFLALLIVGAMTGERVVEGGLNRVSPIWGVAYLAWWAATALPWFAVQVRRFHDQGRSGRFVIVHAAAYGALAVQPVAGWLLFAISMLLMLIPGESQENRYGTVPSDRIGKESRRRPTPIMQGDAQDAADSAASSRLAELVVRDQPGTPDESLDRDVEPTLQGTFRSFGRDFHIYQEAVRYAQFRRESGNASPAPRRSRSERTRDAGSLRIAPPVAEAQPTGTGAQAVTPIEGIMTEDVDEAAVLATDDGRFVSHGYSFSSRKQAARFAERRANRSGKQFALVSARDVEAVSSAKDVATTVPVRDTQRATAPDSNDVIALPDGRFSHAGYSFATYSQAALFAKRRSNPSGGGPARLLSHSRALPVEPKTPQVVDVLRPVIDDAPELGPAEAPDPQGGATGQGVIAAEDGRFAFEGYSFTTRQQAEHFMQRRTSTLTLREKQGSPALKSVSIFRSGSGNQGRSPGFALRMRSKKMAPRWIDTPQGIEVGPVAFDAQFVYFGTPDGSASHRSLIDPRLPVAAGADDGYAPLSYWPSYASLLPEQRRAYLEWLANGRRDPWVQIGYVFLYFYGLERRLIAEKSVGEALAILAEVAALREVYGGDFSFDRHARTLIEASQVALGLPVPAPTPQLDARNGWEMPIALRLHLGRKVHKGVAIDANDALCWALAHPQLGRRAPVARCFDQFKTIWHVRFAEKHPKGIKVRTAKSRLVYQYRSASSEFNHTVDVGDLPDIAAMAGPAARLSEMLTTCADALEPLSRLIGRSPEEGESILAAALCPEEARTPAARLVVETARAALLAKAGRDHVAAMRRADVLAVLLAREVASPERQANYLKRLPAILDALEIGFEPDRRYGVAAPLTDDTPMALFPSSRARSPRGEPGAFKMARTLVELAIIAAGADGSPAEMERRRLAADLAGIPGLDDVDLLRLDALALALAGRAPKLPAVIRRVLGHAQAEQEMMITAAVQAILADKQASPAEVRFLESLFKALGRPREDVYARLHATVAGPLPARARAQAQPSAGAVDPERLERIQRETASVSTLLASIFVEDEEDGAVPESETLSSDEGISLPGLDPSHTAVVLSLVNQPLGKTDFETLCRKHRLLPGGAIETINDWAFDSLDEPAIDDEELVGIQPHLIATIETMSTIA